MKRQRNAKAIIPVPNLTDEERITVCLWGIKRREFDLKAIYAYTKGHLLEWFPKLPSYQALCYRLNRPVPAFQSLANLWMERASVMSGTEMAYLVDSFPIMLVKQA